ncbi:gamma-glutamyl-gamma-aminobutyrate hydrolase family protein [Shewanella morhuae]|uniref:GMP synthase subunit A n=1 Tax=Shewanella morhuae TaxID=365591 RepID=A0A380A9M6_9GAMM|nr:gamma-glutamyl-gamma-aminobutyrate hydrolase family protein [Shewanella morhuae]SUI76021.1 GMP synthase subunit A [Shewanella morhuae]
MIPVYIVQQITLQQHGELHDSLDQRWNDFLLKADILPVLLPNNPDLVDEMLRCNLAEAAIFTGGGEYHNSKSDTRSEVERIIMRWSEIHGYPLVGVCRGMQSMMLYKGSKLKLCEGQVSNTQNITFFGERICVNSFHNFECTAINAEFDIVGTSDDGVVKAVTGKVLPWFGLMWHPERLCPHRVEDYNLFKKYVSRRI